VEVTVYNAGTSTLATLYRNADGSSPQDNPIISDRPTGQIDFYAPRGMYDVVLDSQPIHENIAIGDISTGTVLVSDTQVILPGSSAPTDAVAGTGADSSETGSLYINETLGPIVYINSGTIVFPDWTLLASQPAVSGAGAPTNGVTNGDLNDLYENTTAYASDPTTGWWRCTNGTTNTWAAVTGTIISGAGAPTDAIVGTGTGIAGPGSLYLAATAPYVSGGTILRPTWAAV
jgi:hypothetical protein